jgi:hypothetical protein
MGLWIRYVGPLNALVVTGAWPTAFEIIKCHLTDNHPTQNWIQHMGGSKIAVTVSQYAHIYQKMTLPHILNDIYATLAANFFQASPLTNSIVWVILVLSALKLSTMKDCTAPNSYSFSMKRAVLRCSTSWIV